MSYGNLTDSQRNALNKCASYLGIDPGILASIIQYESRWNPKIPNASGSSAKGLIQFTDGPARALGYSSSADLIAKEDTIEKQLAVPDGPVCRYFKLNSGIRSNDLFGIAMKVFYPAAAISGMGLFDRLPKDVTAANSGISCPFDYIKPVIKAAKQNGIRLPDNDKSVQAYNELVATGKIDETKYGGTSVASGDNVNSTVSDLISSGGGLGLMVGAMLMASKTSSGGKPPSKEQVSGATAAASTHTGDLLGFMAKAA